MEVNVEEKIDITRNNVPGRDNKRPTLIRCGDKSLIALYSKKHVTGVLKAKRMTFEIGTFDVTVPAGQAESSLFGDLSWEETTITIRPSSYAVIVVSQEDGVHAVYASSVIGGLPVGIMNDSVIIGFVNTGSTTIAHVEVAEPDGNYIYAQKQKLKEDAEEPYTESSWEWEWLEYRLNSGEAPKGKYLNNKIHMTYTRDGGIWTRELDLSDPLTFSYVPNYTINNGTINLDYTPFKNVHTSVASTSQILTYIYESLFYVGGVCQTVRYHDPEDAIRSIKGESIAPLDVQIRPPRYWGSYTSYVYSDVIAHFYNESEEDVLQVKISTNNPSTPYWLDELSVLQEGYYSVGIEIYKHGLDNKPYVTPTSERYTFYLSRSEVHRESAGSITVYHPQVDLGSVSGTSITPNNVFSYVQEYFDANDTEKEEIGGIGSTSIVQNNVFSYVQEYFDANDTEKEEIGGIGSTKILCKIVEEI